MLPLGLVVRAEARAPALDAETLATLVRGRRVTGPAALDAVAAGVSLAESPLVQETTVHAVERAFRIVLLEERRRIVIDALREEALRPESVVQQLLVHVPR